MRASLLVLALVGLVCVATGVSAGSFADPDDAALMEIGVDLSAEARAVPAPTFTFDMPANHREPLLAKFPLVHEIKGVQAEDWKEIQGLLTREPLVAEESSVDMKLDELEEQFNRIDAKSTAAPTPAAVAAAPAVAATPAVAVRLAQVGAAPAGAATRSAASAGRGAPAPAAASAPSAAQLAAANAALAALKAAAAKTRPRVGAAPAVAAAAPAVQPAAAASDRIAAQTTARLIEKRLRGLSILFKKFKSQTGMDKDDVAAARVDAALKKQKADALALKKRLAKKGIVRFAQQGQDEDSSAFVESESEAEMESEVEAEAEAEAESEVAADAEAIDGILDTLM